MPLAGLRLNVDILQLQELLMDIGEDEHFQPSMAARGVGSLYGLRLNCRPEVTMLELV